MGKLVKPLIFVLLLLSIGALSLGIMLFGKREIIKTRVQTLEKSTEDVAKAIRYDQLQKSALMDHTRMASQLGPLKVAAENQYLELEDTKATLVKTEDELEETQGTLARTEKELDETKTEVARLEEDVRTKETEIAQKEDEINDLEDENTDLTQQVESLNDDLTTKGNELADARAEYEDLQKAYEEEVRRNLAKDREAVGDVRMDPNVTGTILSVNPEWNFVILDIGSEEGLKANAVMLVHRDQQLVGKIRISDVREHLSVAEVVLDWEQVPVSTGDTVITPQG